MRNLLLVALVILVIALAALLASCAPADTPTPSLNEALFGNSPAPTTTAAPAPPAMCTTDYSESLAGFYGAPGVSLPEVVLVEWTWYISPDNKVIYVDGVVGNVSQRQVRTVRVSAEFRTYAGGNDMLIATQFADVATVDLAPGQKSVFKLAQPNITGIQRVVIRSISWR